MNYDDFQIEFVKENKKLKIALAITLLVSIVGIASILMQRKYFLYRGGALFEERPLAEEVCKQSFLTLAEGSPNPHVVSSELIQIAEKESFSIPVDKLLQVKSLEVGACKIVLKSEGKLAAFKIKLDASDKHPFYYKLIQLDELPYKEEI